MAPTTEGSAGAITTFARWISIVAHPFVMVALMVGGAALRLGSPADAARTMALVAVATVLPVAILMLLQVRRGAWSNVDASNREERPMLFGVGAAGLVALVGYILVAHPGSFLLRGALGTLGMLAACAVATRWIKVSLHLAFATLAATTLLLLGSRLGWVLVPVVPLLGWSRLRLGRHRATEVVVGGVAGVVTAFAIYVI
ncbi:MAG: phosphatase PAP2 family protein [Thermoanaerobaculia bacterium]